MFNYELYMHKYIYIEPRARFARASALVQSNRRAIAFSYSTWSLYLEFIIQFDITFPCTQKKRTPSGTHSADPWQVLVPESMLVLVRT